MLTKPEANALELLGQAFIAFQELPKQHAVSEREFASAIHICQNILLARSGYRELLELNNGLKQQEKV